MDAFDVVKLALDHATFDNQAIRDGLVKLVDGIRSDADLAGFEVSEETDTLKDDLLEQVSQSDDSDDEGELAGFGMEEDDDEIEEDETEKKE